jgi:predicted dinucleotide-binding enzyme
MVGRNLGSALVEKGHMVMMGSRTADNPVAHEWSSSAGDNASHGTFADAAKFGQVLLNCTAGQVSLEALQSAGAENLAGKILIDLSNPLDFSQGFPPTLTVCNDDSIGEQIQREFPEAKVVKTLNTINTYVMSDPGEIEAEHTIFVSGDDDEAKAEVVKMLGDWFGWKPENILDLGDITTSRGVEMYLPLWVRIFAATQNPNFNIHVVMGEKPKQA